MRINLPSGNWVETRDRLLADDRFAVEEAVVHRVELDAQGRAVPVQHVSGGDETKRRNALLARIITAWSFEGVPIPETNIAGAAVIGTVLDLDDYAELSDQVDPLLQKTTARPKPRTSPDS